MLDSLVLRLIALAALVVALLTGGLWYGHTRYKEGVRVTKLEWDTDRATWQTALDKQKRDALSLLVAAQADVDAANVKAVKAAAQQEKDYATYMAGTAALAAQYATRGLRFSSQATATARCGPSGGPAVSSPASAADAPTRTVVQLPDSIAGDLRQFARDADELKGAYGLCVQAVNGGPSL